MTAAVREGEEEIGLAPNQLEVLGCLPAMASKHGLVCSPFVALIDFKNFYPRPNLEEVQDVFSVPLSFFLDESNLNVVKYGAWTSYEWLYTREEVSSCGRSCSIYSWLIARMRRRLKSGD